MKKQIQHIYHGMVVSMHAGLRIERNDGYGSVPGLPDEELADPDELEKRVLKEQFALLDCIPYEKGNGRRWIRPAVLEDGSLDWGAFGSIDFDRLRRHGRDRSWREVDELRDDLANAVIMFDIINDRIGGRVARSAKHRVLRYVLNGQLPLDGILDDDLRALAKWRLRCQGLRVRIRELTESRKRSRSVATVV